MMTFLTQALGDRWPANRLAVVQRWTEGSRRNSTSFVAGSGERIRPRSPEADKLTTALSSLTVELDSVIFDELRTYVAAVAGEITLLGIASVDRTNNTVRIHELLLPRQTCSASHTEVSEAAFADVLMEAIEKDLDPEQIKAWIHSHGEMSCFWSSVDEAAIRGAFSHTPWMLSIVTIVPERCWHASACSNPSVWTLTMSLACGPLAYRRNVDVTFVRRSTDAYGEATDPQTVATAVGTHLRTRMR